MDPGHRVGGLPGARRRPNGGGPAGPGPAIGARSIADIDTIGGVASHATPALELLARAGTPHTIHEYALPERHGRARDARPEYGLDAAAALGVDPARVAKTLVVRLDRARLALVVVAVDRQLDPRRVATALGARTADLAEPRDAERATGGVVGGISPLAPRRPLPVVVDDAILDGPTVLVSAGRRGRQVELAPADLVKLTEAIVAPIARTGPVSRT